MKREDLEVYGGVVENEPLRLHTTYQIGGPADFLIEPDSIQSLSTLIQYLNEENEPWMVLGKGSNVLVSDQPYHGVVISLKESLSHFEFQGDVLYAQAGCSLILLAFEAMEHSLCGLEFASGIPGSLGGGLYMNAGAYLSDLSDVLIDVQVLTEDGLKTFRKDELDFTYRHSLFQSNKHWVIVSARLQLRQGNKGAISHLMAARKQRRLNTQPLFYPCAGSVFRNPPGKNAWQIIEELGYRGRRCGGAMVSDKHCNFIINESGSASAADVDTLIRSIQQDARERFGVDLITEVERINWK